MTELLNQISCILLILSIILGFVRFIKGPNTMNRIIAFDLICIGIIGIVIVFSKEEKTSFYIEMILIFCLLGFVSTIALMESLFTAHTKEKGNDRNT